MEITNPRRILIVSLEGTNTSPILDSLLSKAPNKSSKPISSTSRSDELFHIIDTPYYSAQIPIWQETISIPDDWAAEWRVLDGANEVVRAAGAWIFAFERPRDEAGLTHIKSLLQQTADMISYHRDQAPYANPDSFPDTLLLAVGLPQHQLPALDLTAQQWDDACRDAGAWEYIDAEARGKNEFGELSGFERMREALQTGEWELVADDDAWSRSDIEGRSLDGFSDIVDGDEMEHSKLFAGLDGDLELQQELQRIMEGKGSGMGEPILGSRKGKGSAATAGGGGARDASAMDVDGDGDGEENDVDDLQRMFLKLQAARDLGADLPQAERRKLAAKAVREVMMM